MGKNNKKNLTKKSESTLSVLKRHIFSDEIQGRLSDIMGEQSKTFANSIINVFRNNEKLQKCSPASIGSAAIQAATFNLSIDPVLAQSAIVPYGRSATFQLMYKGLIQLCIRSGMYRKIDCTEIYKDELDYYNPITGEVVFNDPKDFKLRDEGGGFESVVGHYARFELLSGFVKTDYMTKKSVLKHAKKYSKSYQYDLNKGIKNSCWSTNPIVMGNKTVLIRLLSKYGVKSIEMEKAMRVDFDSFLDEQDEVERKKESQMGTKKIKLEGEDDPETKKKAKKQIEKMRESSKDESEKKETPDFMVDDDE